jgi:hypothetical protein
VTRAREIASQGGLVLLNTTTFSAQSSVSFNNVFSSTYTHYKVVWNGTSSTGFSPINLRARSNATDVTSGYYCASRWDSYNGTSGSSDVSNGGFATLFIGWSIPTNFHFDTFATGNDLFFTGLGHGTDVRVTRMAGVGGGAGGVPVTGFTIFPTSGTITGTFRIYGYRN